MDFSGTGASKEYIICYYWYSLDKRFKFESDVCNRSHDVLMTSINLNVIATLNVFGVGYGCITNRISKSEAINLLQNPYLIEKSGTL